jgi:lysophospholipase L1-like esterase
MVSGEVINVPLSTGKLFSNRKADRLLYFAEDELKTSWSEKEQAAAVGNLKRIQEDLAKKGLRLVVLVVPDKSSAYRPYLANEAGKVGYPDVSEQLKTAGVNNVNLLSYFQHAAGATVDLYLPNDTHLSTQGYKLMASKVADETF